MTTLDVWEGESSLHVTDREKQRRRLRDVVQGTGAGSGDAGCVSWLSWVLMQRLPWHRGDAFPLLTINLLFFSRHIHRVGVPITARSVRCCLCRDRTPGEMINSKPRALFSRSLSVLSESLWISGHADFTWDVFTTLRVCEDSERVKGYRRVELCFVCRKHGTLLPGTLVS